MGVGDGFNGFTPSKDESRHRLQASLSRHSLEKTLDTEDKKMTDNSAEFDWPDQKEFMVEFNKELQAGSDRALVLVTGAMIDELLRRLLVAALPYARDDLFEGGNATLGSLSARSNLVRALGLVSEDDYRRLNLLRKMRNEMAHKLSLTLSDGEFVNRVRELWIGIEVSEMPDDRINFGAAGLYLIMLLSVRIADVRKQPAVRPIF